MDKLTYYPDYDAKKGVKLKTIDEKIDYLQSRILKILINPLKELLSVRQNSNKHWDLNIGIVTLICEGLSGLSTYYKGKGKGTKFQNYVNDFMSSEFKKNPYLAKILWKKFRCALSHGFYIECCAIETNPHKYIDYDQAKDKLSLDLVSFYKDFESSFWSFIKRLKKQENKEFRKIFKTRFDKVFPSLVH